MSSAIELKKKIGAWLSDKDNNENDLVDFLLDECGVKEFYTYGDEKEQEEEPRHGDQDEDGDIYCGGCSKFCDVCDFSRDLKDGWCDECEEDSDEEEEEEEFYCSKCNIFLTEDDLNMDDGTMCEDCLDQQEEEKEWNSETEWDDKPTPPCWWHLLKEIEKHRKKEEKPKKKKRFIIKKKK
jgi:hypothetical protein